MLGRGGNGSGEEHVARKVTVRQRQILDLAATGLSDKQIAQRLGVSHRTVRTHLEKLYRDRGIRNRSEAIAIWSRQRSPLHARPADECPYPKPFPPNFAECPAYQATQMIAIDISYRPLGSFLTCRHLESRLMPERDGHWYGACMIGDAAARRRWSTAVGVDRLQRISDLRQEITAIGTPFVQRLWELKAAERKEPSAELRQEMDATVADFMGRITTLLTSRRSVLDELHLPLDACVRLVRMAIERFVAEGLGEGEWEVPDELLALFPEELRAYFRPRQIVYPVPPSGQASA